MSEAKVTESAAAASAQAAFQRVAGNGDAAQVSAKGRWAIDPLLIGASADLPIRTAWRFELHPAQRRQRRLVIVDDQTGFVLMNNDMIGHAKRRIVCDNAQVPQNPNVVQAPCVNSSSNKVRGEGDPPAALAEANTAYALGGAVHDGFLAFGIPDLTELIGRDIGGGVKALSQTVRWCYSSSPCPYANAFWDGSRHVLRRRATPPTTSWLTSSATGSPSGPPSSSTGASPRHERVLSDILGEIIDHRHVAPGDVPRPAGTLGRGPAAIPGRHPEHGQSDPRSSDPDRTSSPLYVREARGRDGRYADDDGVHCNSGVGNKTFYLVSQGGTFNSQTITGIDVPGTRP